MSKKNEPSGFFQTTHGRLSRHQHKKTKKNSQEKDHKQLIQYIDKYQGQPLASIYQSQRQAMPGHYELGIWRRKVGMLMRSHIPSYVKLLDYGQINEPCFTPSRANINPKKNNKSDILIEDPVTQKTRLIKMQTFPILLSPYQLVFYRLSFNEFKKVFQASEFSNQDLKKVFSYCIQQCESATGTNKYLLWPAVILEGLNYKFQEIKQFILNFKISNTQNVKLIQNLLKIINDFSFGQVQSQSNIKLDSIENQQKNQGQKQKSQHDQIIRESKQILEYNDNEEVEMEEQGIQTQMHFCVWLIGTAQFTFTNKNMKSWNIFPQQSIKNLFATTVFSPFIKEMNQIIDSLNKHKKLREAQLKADEQKSFLNRISTYKSDAEGQYLCIPLRFEFIKGVGKRILIKILKSEGTQLRWVPTESATVNYTIPQISKKEMNFLYLSRKISPLDIVTSCFYRQFLFLSQKETSEIFYNLYPQFLITQEQAKKQKCISCQYLIRQMSFKHCFFCKKFCHEQCSIQNRKKLTNSFTQEVFAENTNIPYICQQCQPCIVCLQAVEDDFLFCSNCFSYTHFECGRIKGLEQNESKMQHLKINDKYVCQFCLKCKMCSHKLKDSEYLIMDNQFFCCECSDKIKSNNHCHVCMKKKQGGSTMKWIQCGDAQCSKWVHQICDPQFISVVKSPSATDPYLCPFCRLVQRRKIYIQIINSLTVFDQAQFFTDPTYKTIPFYDALISEPMCFTVMKQKALEGKYDQNPYQKIDSDFQLIIKNARRFNMPKDTAHVQAKILKVLGEKAMQKFKPLFTSQLRSLISGAPLEEIKNLRLQLHRQINNHYPEILLNYKASKSFIEIRENKKKGNEQQLRPQDEVKFNSAFILNNFFRNSSIVFHLKKQKIGIANLFTMPKNENQRGIWHSIKGDLCYYHNNKDIIFSCNQCCESYCCMKECIRHRICTVCGQKGCRCDNYQCGCTPLKQKERKIIEAKLFQKYMEPLKTHREVLMQITQNFKYCLKCAQDRLITRMCAACQGLCSWGYFKCPGCQKMWHKNCYPNLLSVNYASYAAQLTPPRQQYGQADLQLNNLSTSSNPYFSLNRVNLNNTSMNRQVGTTCPLAYCRDCFNNLYPNNYQQALTLESKAKIVKITKITRYMRIFIQVYFNQGIRLTPFEIQQLILDNYDQFSVRQQLFKEYELNYSIIQRFRDFTFKINAAIQRSCAEYLNDYTEIKKNNSIIGPHLEEVINQNEVNDIKWVDSHSYLMRCKKIWWKYFRYNFLDHDMNHTNFCQQNPCWDLQLNKRKLKIEKIRQVRQKLINQAYTYKDYNSHHIEVLKNYQNIIESIKSGSQQANYEENFQNVKQYRNYLQSLRYISTLDQSFYQKLHHYRFTLIYHPRSMPFEYRLNPTFKKKSNLQQATKQFLLGIYQESKNCLRNGSTCILKETHGHKDMKQYWSVLKRWDKGRKQMHIILKKKNDRWYLKIDEGFQKIVYEIQEIISEITKKNPDVKITSFKQLGQFLGFTIFQPFYKANHFTNFLQTNLVDQMSLLDKMNRITQLYQSFSWGDNGIFEKSGPIIPYNSISSAEGLSEKKISYQYSMGIVKPQYLSKKPKKMIDKSPKRLQKRISNPGVGTQLEAAHHIQPDQAQQVNPFISFEDLKRYLVDFSAPIQAKLQISLKNCQILNEVFIAPSKIHKLGLFSRRNIKKHAIVIEYMGEIVSESVADLRQKKFHYGCYLFGILKEMNKQNQDKKDIIDATFRGNMARYLNHSCDPNCKAKTQYLNGSPRIIIYTIRDIGQFQELTYDYQFNVDAVEKLECTCGAKNCQGRLN